MRKVVPVVLDVLAVFFVARLSLFMLDASKPQHSFAPSSRWDLQHNCLTAYYVAANAVRTTPNVWDSALYSASDDDPSQPRKPLTMGAFQVDVFEYPPPFLLLPKALSFVTPDFSNMRGLWFVLNVAGLLGGMLAIAKALGPGAGRRAMLLIPLVFLSPPTLSLLQKGNVQGLIIAASMLAMLLFARGRPALGGAILAFAIASKIYPGLLVVYLIARREWRAVAWTAAFGIAWCLATLAAFGWAPWDAFLRHLPSILSGEAFPAFRRPAAVAINLSIPGLVFKSKLFGLPAMGFAISKAVGWVYTVVLLGAIVWVARRTVRPEHAPIVWLAILLLGTLRSPFLPVGYAAVPAVWLLTLLAATRELTPRSLVAVTAAWLALSVYLPTDVPIDVRWLALIMFVPQAALVAIGWVGMRRPAPA